MSTVVARRTLAAWDVVDFDPDNLAVAGKIEIVIDIATLLEASANPLV